MIDDLKTLVSISAPIEVSKQVKEPFYFANTVFRPIWHENGFITYRAELENLRLELAGNQLTISNSWHKYQLGNNFSDYYFSDIHKTVSKLEEALQCSLSNAEVKKIAYGCVINDSPKNTYTQWLTYKGKNPLPMIHKNKQYGACFCLSQFKIKGYDKTFEVKKHDKVILDRPYFRFEKEVKNMKHIRDRKEPIEVYKLIDITNRINLEQMAQDLIETYALILKTPEIDFSVLRDKDLKILAVMQNNAIREYYKAHKKETYKNYQKRYKELTSVPNYDNSNQVLSKIENKLSVLLAG